MTGQLNFNSHTDMVVLRTVELVNVLTPGERQGRPYPRPASGRLPGLIGAALTGRGQDRTSDPAARMLAAAADVLRTVFEAVDRDDLDTAAGTVNALLERHGARPHLERHDGERWHLHFHGSEDSVEDGWVAGCATALAVVLGSEYARRLGVCSAPACDRVYVDTSRNGTRRFCSTACQNRVKAAAFRARNR